jgi:hypothetical protein
MYLKTVTDVSEECTVSISKVKELTKQVTSNIQSVYSYTLKMEAICFVTNAKNLPKILVHFLHTNPCIPWCC